MLVRSATPPSPSPSPAALSSSSSHSPHSLTIHTLHLNNLTNLNNLMAARPPQSCPHLTSYHSTSPSPTPFRHIKRCLRIHPSSFTLPSITLDSPPHCPLCPSSSSSSSSSSPPSPSPTTTRLLACLSCAHIFCPRHASSHPLTFPGHHLSVDITRAELFCCSCSDQIYDSHFDSTVSLAQSQSQSHSQSFSTTTSTSALAATTTMIMPVSKRRRVDFKQWKPDVVQSQLIRTRSTILVSDPSSSGSGSGSDEKNNFGGWWGLRGLNNMGNTCFLNSVLQALLHTPPLRNYFLSDRHNRFLCAKTKTKTCSSLASSGSKNNKKKKKGVDTGGGGGGGSAVDDLCLVCDLDQIYSAVFSGDRTPFSPAKFLYSWWRHSADHASYEQQDAHEFFISILDRIHDNLVKDQQNNSSNSGQGDCCIAHRVFSGILRSDVTCTYCGFTSTTYDPCIDLSVDLDSTHLTRQTARNGAKETKHKHKINQNLLGQTTLMRCLEKFTRPERLDNDQKFYCQNCKERRESLKQMSIRKLPLVLCFHVKRFEHSTVKKTSRKIDSCLQFPFSLDMAPYLSSSVLRSRYGNRLFPAVTDNGASEGGMDSGVSSEFEIFAVVTHSGRLDAGHYVTYLRINNSWYKCDDAWVIKVEESTVRESQAYMLFYVQKVLCYAAGGNTGTS